MTVLKPTEGLNPEALRIALSRLVHPEDIDKAIRRLMAVRPAGISGSLPRKLNKTSAIRPYPPSECSGKSIIEMIWQELDTTMERLMEGGAAEGDEKYALGLASAISIIQNPYRPDVEHVRAEAVRRYEAEYGDDA